MVLVLFLDGADEVDASVVDEYVDARELVVREAARRPALIGVGPERDVRTASARPYG